jgi:hypothetical protein
MNQNTIYLKKCLFIVAYVDFKVNFFKVLIIIYVKIIYDCKAGFMDYLAVLLKNYNNVQVIFIIGNSVS